jgi:hypothetical protein
MKTTILALLFLLIPLTAIAQQPIPKQGQFCPRDYKPDTSWCIPNNQARFAIVKIGAFCPRHFRVDGNYCIATDKAPASVIQKTGPFCPSGYKVDGEYCVK